MRELTKTFRGEGGGHVSVAVVELEAPLEEVFNHLRAYIGRELSILTGKKLLRME